MLATIRCWKPGKRRGHASSGESNVRAGHKGRWGMKGQSMGAFSNGRIFMATEMIPQGIRDFLTNWGTFIYSAPPP
jgi:hypothetical protein